MRIQGFKEFYKKEKEEHFFDKVFEKYYNRGHFGKIEKKLIREQQHDWFKKLKILINERDFQGLMLALGERKNKISRELFQKLTGLKIKAKTTKIIEQTLEDFCFNE